jgi:ATP-binding cassette, subfamily B, bacterial MsbA
LTNFEMYKRFWPYARAYLNLMFIALMSTIVVSATSGAIAWLVKPVLDSIFINKDRHLLYMLPLIVLVVFSMKAVFSYVQSYTIQTASNNVIRDLRNDVYGIITYMPIRDYQKTTTGNLIARVTSDVAVLNKMGIGSIKNLLQQVFTILSLLVVVFMRNWKFALIAVTVFPFAGYFVSKYGKRVRGITRKAQEQIAELINLLQENITGHRIVKIFSMEDEEHKRFVEVNQQVTSLSIKNAKVSSRVAPSMEALAGVAIAVIILLGGLSVMDGHSTPGEFFSFTTALFMLYQPVKTLGNLHNDMQQAMAAAERVFDIMGYQTEKEMITSGINLPVEVREAIRYNNVSFRYDETERQVLSGIDLTIKRGEVVALVGSSGGGKTTLVNLLPRFYEPDGGSIAIDSMDIKKLSLGSLRGAIALVTQDTILFNQSIRDNIAYGKKDYTMEQVEAAAKAAHADGFIKGLPNGYDTVIGEKGVRLSGGEKQRISIARAIMKDCPILILDEATSSLDTESERIVQKALENLMKNRTTLVIAHRLSTIINADRIVVVQGGRIMETGRHDELLVKSPLYKKLYEMQFSGPKEDYVEAR